MPDLIRRIAPWLRLLLTLGTGKRRRTRHRPHPTAVPLTTATPTSPTTRLLRHRSPYGLATPLDGAASRLVRPYLLAHTQEAALRQRRRLALVLAADFGIDLDRHLVGAPEVAAA
ncbi:hypothetical protein DDQ41_15900 [Streptomyces spongiicola]|uniref:Uncharacterized protein n=1 Tax=Streptomyces spongiicola TaxID=1690221 RepID=A0ABM6V844_9ACTN|nr:hypothetical protein [Streptomyces spongiicola]AWK10133.1 hypothetical protein DDQ41_15900 [Streptomyces spongiicola]